MPNVFEFSLEHGLSATVEFKKPNEFEKLLKNVNMAPSVVRKKCQCISSPLIKVRHDIVDGWFAFALKEVGN